MQSESSILFRKIRNQKKIPKIRVRRVLLVVILLVLSYLFLFPFFWMLSSSLKTEKDMFLFPIKWIPKKILWENYYNAWTKAKFNVFYLNSIKVSLIVTFGQVVTSIMAAYAFAKIAFKGKNVIFLIYIGTMMIPFQVLMIPQFLLFRVLNIYDTHWALILPAMFSAFGTFMLRQYFLGIPLELSEAARIDGCSEFRIMTNVIVPLSMPAILSLSIFILRWTWNDYLAPLIYINKQSLKTIPLGLAQFSGEYETAYTMIMAAAIIAVLPMVIAYLSAQKSFIKGIAMSGVKG
jgi:multiple sugar transport system permease protein